MFLRLQQSRQMMCPWSQKTTMKISFNISTSLGIIWCSYTYEIYCSTFTFFKKCLIKFLFQFHIIKCHLAGIHQPTGKALICTGLWILNCKPCVWWLIFGTWSSWLCVLSCSILLFTRSKQFKKLHGSKIMETVQCMSCV